MYANRKQHREISNSFGNPLGFPLEYNGLGPNGIVRELGFNDCLQMYGWGLMINCYGSVMNND